jgi:hypothetical protein
VNVPQDIVIDHDERFAEALMDVIPDWPQFTNNPLVGPPLKGAPKINADNLT